MVLAGASFFPSKNSVGQDSRQGWNQSSITVTVEVPSQAEQQYINNGWSSTRVGNQVHYTSPHNPNIRNVFYDNHSGMSHTHDNGNNWIYTRNRNTYNYNKNQQTWAINNTKPYTINKVLGLGVGRTNPPIKHQDYFDKIIPLSQGNKHIDYSKATIDHLKIPVTNLKKLHGEKINEYWAHSWHADVIINEIKQGNIKVNKLILIDPPGAYRNWAKELHGTNTNVEIYSAKKSGFRFIPEISTRNITHRRGHYKETVPTMGYTLQFGAGENNIHHIPTTHSLDSSLDVIFKQKGIDTSKHLESTTTIYIEPNKILSQPSRISQMPSLTESYKQQYGSGDFWNNIKTPKQITQQPTSPIQIPGIRQEFNQRMNNNNRHNHNFNNAHISTPSRDYSRQRSFSRPPTPSRGFSRP